MFITLVVAGLTVLAGSCLVNNGKPGARKTEPLRYEAEMAVMLGGANSIISSAASNGLVAGGMKKSGDGLEFGPVAGGFMLGIRYASTDAYANLSLYVNGRFALVLPFKATWKPDLFNTQYFRVNMPAGSTLKIVRNETDRDVMIDYIELSGKPMRPAPELKPDPTPAPVPVSHSAGIRTEVSLNGTWLCQEVTAAGKDVIPEKWRHTIPVPGLSEMAKPVIYGNDDTYDYIFYKKDFRLAGKVPATVHLKIDKGWYGKKVWVNGRSAGEHFPNFTPAFFDIAPFVKGGGAVNTLVIRVGKRYTVPPGIHVGDDQMVRYNYMPGLYDNVRLILAGNPFITGIRTAPDLINKTMRVVAQVRNSSEVRIKTPVTAELYEVKCGKLAGSAISEVILDRDTEGCVDLNVPVADCMAWSPESPFLYELVVKTADDRCSKKVGMRTFQFDPVTRKPLLNDSIYMIRGTSIPMYRFFEDSERGSLPWDKEWARKIIRLYKGLNMNALRFHVSFAPEIWYEVCDEEGYLVQDEYPIWGGGIRIRNNVTADTLTPEISDWIFERNNHPCLIIWDICNETKTPHATAVIGRCRTIDLQNRPWDNGYGDPQAPTDIRELHPYYQMGVPDWTPELLSTNKIADQNVPPPNPVCLNEYSWTWLNRDGSPQYGPAAYNDEFYEKFAPGATVAERQYKRAMVLAQETEWHRANRHAMVQYFVGLSFCRNTPENIYRSDTCDDLVPGIAPQPRFNQPFQEWMQDAFAPVGLMIDYFKQKDKAGSERVISVYVMNDEAGPWTGTVSLGVWQETKMLNESSQVFSNVATGYRDSREFKVKLPEKAGKYKLVARYAERGRSARSVRDVELE